MTTQDMELELKNINQTTLWGQKYFRYRQWEVKRKSNFKKKKNISVIKMMKTYGIIFLQWNFEFNFYYKVLNNIIIID